MELSGYGEAERDEERMRLAVAVIRSAAAYGATVVHDETDRTRATWVRVETRVGPGLVRSAVGPVVCGRDGLVGVVVDPERGVVEAPESFEERGSAWAHWCRLAEEYAPEMARVLDGDEDYWSRMQVDEPLIAAALEEIDRAVRARGWV